MISITEITEKLLEKEEKSKNLEDQEAVNHIRIMEQRIYFKRRGKANNRHE